MKRVVRWLAGCAPLLLITACSSDDDDNPKNAGGMVGVSGASGSGGSGPSAGGSSGKNAGGSGGSSAGSAGSAGAPSTAETFGPVHSGSYHEGPVDFAETMFPNSCAPYPARIQQLEGAYLAGVDNSQNGDGRLCDACALITTRLGKKIVVRIITTGVSNAAGDMDLSLPAYDAIHEDDPQGTSSNPRPMTWQLAKCPDTGKIHLQYQTGAHTDWTSFWVRNPKLPVEKVEVRSARHASLFALRREADGTFNDDGGFGEGQFELRITGFGAAVVNQTFPSFTPGSVAESTMQFP